MAEISISAIRCFYALTGWLRISLSDLLFGFLGAMLKLYRSTSVGPICSYASGEVLIVSIMYVFVRIDRAVVLMLNIFLVSVRRLQY